MTTISIENCYGYNRRNLLTYQRDAAPQQQRAVIIPSPPLVGESLVKKEEVIARQGDKIGVARPTIAATIVKEEDEHLR